MKPEEHVEELLAALDIEDITEHPHLKDTPRRFVQALRELTAPIDFNFTTFPNTGIDTMITMQDVPFYTLCAHHLLPFFGVAHIGYIPNKKIVGISKLGRTVKYFSRGLNIQEELTQDIANYLDERLEPRGVAVVLQGEHLCMSMRGAEAPGHKTTTSAMQGVFLDSKKEARSEFLSLIKGRA